MHTPSFNIKLIAIALLGLFLTACTQPASDPKSIANQYWQHLQSGNTLAAEKLISIGSHRTLFEHSDRMASISQLNNGEAKTIVSTTITTITPNTNFTYTETFNTVLVLQQGEWKVDVNQSQIPATALAPQEELQQLSEKLSGSMQENFESIDETMNEGMQLLKEALRDGSKEMGDSLLNMMNNLNSKMQESIEKMKERRQEHTQPSQKNPDPAKGEGII